jgi:glycosyltransferase involved in cell wall biosynthesis
MSNLNDIKFIKKSLDSLKSQTLRPKELIVVDGGSMDGSLEVAQAIADIVYTVKGLGAQRLYGILASQGNYICSANSDTLYPRSYLQNASRHLLNPEVEANTGPCKPIPEKCFNLIGEAQGILSHILYLILPGIYEHNLCFKTLSLNPN